MKRNFLTLILSLILVVTSLAPVGANAAELSKTSWKLYYGSVESSFAIGSATTSLSDANYEGAYADSLLKTLHVESATSKAIGKYNSVATAVSEGDIIKMSFSMGSDKYYEWNAFIDIVPKTTLSDGTQADLDTIELSVGAGYCKFEGVRNAANEDIKDIFKEKGFEIRPAVENTWNKYEIVMTIGGETTPNKIVIYKDGVKWCWNDDYLKDFCEKNGPIKQIGGTSKEISFIIHKRVNYPFFLADVVACHYPKGIESKDLVILTGNNCDSWRNDKGFVKSDDSASVSVENYANTEKDLALIIASYNDDGSLAELTCKSEKIYPKLERTLEVKLNEGTSGKTVKDFLWDSLTGLTPLDGVK